MAINLKFDLMGSPEPPSIVLANRNGNKLGQLNVNVDSIDVKDALKLSEFSFTLNKYIDGNLTPLWNKVVDFKLVNCPEWDLWFEIKVELDETTETVKTVYCTQLGQAELSQIKVYDIHINEEGDPNWDTNNETYKSTVLCDKEHTDVSLLHRLLKDKAPHYSIDYVDESIQRIQRQFSFDDTSICDAFDEISEEIGCLFVYNSNSQAGGKPNRSISVYDLQQNCNNKSCKHRGEFTDKCPKCGSTDITYGYGEDTTIFVTSDELATDGIQLVTDTDSVKNCFKLEGGDDLMTATIRNCNPNGSDYIWYFSDSMKEDMSKELVDRIESYDEKYQDCYNNRISNLDETLVNQYNNLVEKYGDYYNTKSTCLDCGTKGDFEEQCTNPNCNSKNILAGQKLQTIPTTITGYPALMTAYYNTIDLLLYLESGLMPNVEMSDTKAEDQIKLLTTTSLSPVAINVEKIKNASLATANSAVLSMAKVLIRPTYKVDIVDDSSSLNETISTDNNGEYRVWTGKFIVTNYSDETDTATNEVAISVRINNATETFIKQKIDKALNKENTDDLSISGLFDEETYSYDAFRDELKKYALNPLKSFYEACDVCIGILTEQGAGNEDEKLDLYEKLYKPYFDKQQAINNEIKIRENEIAIIEGVWDKSDENSPKCTTWGLQQYIEDCQKGIQDALNFEDYLGEDLWLEFCAYRREDKYSNSNYVSDGLNNAELFNRANEFIEVAEEEIFKSAELQHSISATLNNLLSLPKFKPLLHSFKTGNWIRVQVDDEVYKLRLLEYDFGYGDSESISVEFSDVTKIKNGTTDLQDIFSQTASMASSYDSVQRQAQKGDVARGTIDQWLVDGLNSANVQIKSNDSEEVLLTKSGLLARSYDDITGTYLPEQFKLTHNIMAYTDDNWKTVSAALGKHNYKYYKDGNLVDAEGYGLSAKFAQAAHIIGSQFIGGEIVSSNYKPQAEGTYINLLNGEFDFAGGKIVYDINDDEPEKSTLTLKGVTIQWDSLTDKPTIENIDGLSNITDDIRAIEQGLQATTINGQYVISPHIVGGDLKIIGDNEISAQISSAGVLTATGANITGDITATSLTLGSNVKISTTNIDGIDEYAKISDIEGVPDNILTAESINISESKTENGITTQTITVGDKEYTNIVSGDFVFTDIGLGTDTTDGSKRYTCISKDGLLTAKNAIIYGTIYATNGEFTGIINANNGGSIAGWQIDEDSIFKDGMILTTSDDLTYQSLITNTQSPIRINVGEIQKATYRDLQTQDYETIDGKIALYIKADATVTSAKLIDYGCSDEDYVDAMFGAATIEISDDTIILHIENPDQDENIGFGFTVEYVCLPRFCLLGDGSLYANAACISGTIEGSHIKGSTITGGSLLIGDEDGYHAWISEDGILNANGANITGIVNATNGGSIGGWDIVDNTLTRSAISNETGNPKLILSDTIRLSHNGTSSSGAVTYDTYADFGWADGSQVVDGKVFPYYGLTTNSNLSFSVGYGRQGRLSGDWVCQGTWTESNSSSDMRIKNSISNYTTEYDILFDNLKPRRYKYNDGTSNRYHTGYIAQEVVEAIENAGLTTQDFAGVMLMHPNTEDECWYLRRDEFVSLNTWQIQKLKARIIELEERVSKLENK